MNKSSVYMRRRVGFTVVELLVVIAIIAILAALITPAIWTAMKRAGDARVKIEMGELAKALEQYKNQMGEYPPDFSEIGASDMETIALKRDAIDRHLANVYRYRNTQAHYVDSPPGDGLRDEDLQLLNPSNALYFWLRGFYEDKQRPLTGRKSRRAAFTQEGRTPFFEFDEGRLVSPPQSSPVGVNPNPFAIDYYAKGDSQQRPIIYYRAAQSDPNAFPYQSAFAWSQATAVRQNFNARSTVSGSDLEFWGPPAPYASATAGRVFAEPEKYQLITAGRDGLFGAGGKYTMTDRGPVPVAGMFQNGAYESQNGTHKSKFDNDNITSFTDQVTLEDSVQ